MERARCKCYIVVKLNGWFCYILVKGNSLPSKSPVKLQKWGKFSVIGGGELQQSEHYSVETEICIMYVYCKCSPL